MNKKAYSQPTVKVVKIQLTTIIAASITRTSGDGPGVGGEWGSGTHTSNARKSGSLWDEE